MKKFDEIIIKFVDEDQQRKINGKPYETLGDYYFEKNVLHIDILKTDEANHRTFELLTLIHEIVEAVLVIKRGISISAIDNYDMEYNAIHKDGEPGDEKDSPYFKEHFLATKIEKLMAKELGVKWSDYN